MTTIKSLKVALNQRADTVAPSTRRKLLEKEYQAGFEVFMQGSGWETYRDFIIPQLSKLLTPLFDSCASISVLEIGPGPKSVLGYLPSVLRQKIASYTVLELNRPFASSLEVWLSSSSKTTSPFHGLEKPVKIVRALFRPNDPPGPATQGKFDVILFCHSMYGIQKEDLIERALEMVSDRGIIVIFHRDGYLPLDGLVCHRTATFPTGTVSVADKDEVLDSFATWVAGCVLENASAAEAIRPEWRKACRAIGRREEAYPTHLTFSSPDVMVALTGHAKLLPELAAPRYLPQRKDVKNGEARLHRPTGIRKPTTIHEVQHSVQWAAKHRVGLSVVGGGHSGHCLWPNAVAIDMEVFQQIHILTDGGKGSHSGPVVVAGSGCKTGDIIRKAMEANLTLPLGSRPSVGAGLWLQGGIGHLSRMHGLACDAIVGAVIVSVDSGRILYVGQVPISHRPRDAICPDNEADLLWVIKGAGTNFGIVVSVTFKAYPAPTYSTRDWVVPIKDELEARERIADFDESFASKIPRNCSADAYLYWEADKLRLGITMIKTSTQRLVSTAPIPTPPAWMGPGSDTQSVDGTGLFEADLYMSKMHGGHDASKTSAFKRCVFLKDIGSSDIANSLVKALKTRTTPLSYIHLLQGGEAIRDVPANLSAFGCRDWDFACVITGVWPHEKDGTEVAHAAMQWVYRVAKDLLPLSHGAYGADLGPDPRDAALATKAFGSNRPRLSRLKRLFDPHHVLPYAIPLPEPNKQRIVFLISGEHGAGKDYCADFFVRILTGRGVTARTISISELTKRQYAAAMGADLDRLLHDRAYKEEHRPALTTFFQNQVRDCPRLAEKNFLGAVYSAVSVDALFITGIRDDAPVTANACSCQCGIPRQTGVKLTSGRACNDGKFALEDACTCSSSSDTAHVDTSC